MDFVETVVKTLEVRMSHISKAWSLYFQKHKDLFGVADSDPKEALSQLKNLKIVEEIKEYFMVKNTFSIEEL